MNQLFESNLPEDNGSICLAAHAEVDGYRRSILLIEDESFVREVTREILISAGYRVLGARNALEATQIYERRHSEIDLVITDVVLPGESGRLLAVRLQGHNPELKVLFMSGYRDQPEFRGNSRKASSANRFRAICC